MVTKNELSGVLKDKLQNARDKMVDKASNLRESKLKPSQQKSKQQKPSQQQREQEDKEVRQEAKKYWDSLSEEERKKIAAQYFADESKANAVARANKIDNDNIDRRIEQRRKIMKMENAERRRQFVRSYFQPYIEMQKWSMKHWWVVLLFYLLFTLLIFSIIPFLINSSSM